MSLNYDITGIENVDELKTFGVFSGDSFMPKQDGDSFVLTPQLECLIWLSLLTGISKITEHNWQETYIRVHAIETVAGAYRRTSTGESVYYTPAEVKRCIGLKTNTEILTAAAFNHRLASMVRRPAYDLLSAFDQLEENKNDQDQDAVETETKRTA